MQCMTCTSLPTLLAQLSTVRVFASCQRSHSPFVSGVLFCSKKMYVHAQFICKIKDKSQSCDCRVSHVQEWRQLEAELLLTKVPIPVYFVPEDTGLTLIHNKLANNAEKESKSSVLYRKSSVLWCYMYIQVASYCRAMCFVG